MDEIKEVRLAPAPPAAAAASVGSGVSVASGPQVFSKCGVIKEDEERQPRIKIYRDKGTGEPKGDGLVIFLKACARRPQTPCSLPCLHPLPCRRSPL